MPQQTWLNLADVANLTGLSVRTLRRRIAAGHLPAYRTGRIIKIRSTDVDTLMVAIPTADAQ